MTNEVRYSFYDPDSGHQFITYYLIINAAGVARLNKMRSRALRLDEIEFVIRLKLPKRGRTVGRFDVDLSEMCGGAELEEVAPESDPALD